MKNVEPDLGNMDKKLKVVEYKLDGIIRLPQIDQSKSIMELNNTVVYIQDDFSSFKNEMRKNLKNHDAMLRKIDVLIKRIVQLENEVKILRRN